MTGATLNSNTPGDSTPGGFKGDTDVIVDSPSCQRQVSMMRTWSGTGVSSGLINLMTRST